MAFGENHDFTLGGTYNTIHAEEHALNKLPPAPPRKNKPRIDILVIRTTHSGYMGSSRPCLRCTMLLYKMVPAKGYILGNVYYTVSNETIVKTTIEDLVVQQQAKPHVTVYYRAKALRRMGIDPHDPICV